jgi:hypothetical protein
MRGASTEQGRWLFRVALDTMRYLTLLLLLLVGCC